MPSEDLWLYEGAVFVVPEFNLVKNGFSDRYYEAFGKKPTHQGAYAYDGVNLLYDAIINTDGISEEVIKYIKNLNNYTGVVGEIELLSNGDTKSNLVFVTYSNGTIVKY